MVIVAQTMMTPTRHVVCGSINVLRVARESLGRELWSKPQNPPTDWQADLMIVLFDGSG